jgi:hypothetical protein
MAVALPKTCSSKLARKHGVDTTGPNWKMLTMASRPDSIAGHHDS